MLSLHLFFFENYFDLLLQYPPSKLLRQLFVKNTQYYLVACDQKYRHISMPNLF